MKRFRDCLNLALSKQALGLRLVADEVPHIILPNQSIESDFGPVLTSADLKQIINTALPNQWFNSQSAPIVGSLNVGSQGVLKVRSWCDGQLRISLYFPSSGNMFEKDEFEKKSPLFTQLPGAPSAAGTAKPTSIPLPVISASNNSGASESNIGALKIPALEISSAGISLLDIGGFATPKSAASGKSIPGFSIPGLSIPGLSIPDFGNPNFANLDSPTPDLSPKILSIPGLSIPGLSIPGLESVGQNTSDKIPEVSSTDHKGNDAGTFNSAPARLVAPAEISVASRSPAPIAVASPPPMNASPIESKGEVTLAKNPVPPVKLIVPAPKLFSVDREDNAEINFGNDVAGEGKVSDGNNPIDQLLKEMVKLRASDIHLTLGQPIIFRIDGDISRMGSENLTSDMMARFLLPTIPNRSHAEFMAIQDTDYAYEIQGVGRFRVNIFRDRNGVCAVMRHIPAQILTVEQLGLSPAITKLCQLSKGLVLVTGATGSGKSTTLAAMLDLINKTRMEHILTIEDPIEFVHAQQMCLVNQREVRKHTGSFGRALKAALREDPDVVLIGELRDLETIAIAIETAETGHLVLATLHTTTAISTVDRIIDQFPADRQSQIRTMLASSLKGVVAQTLLKKKSGGRVAAHEILISNDAVGAMIREGKIHNLSNHMLTNKADGNQFLNEALINLVQDGVVNAKDAFFKSIDKNGFLLTAKQRGIHLAA